MALESIMKLSSEQLEKLIGTLEARFENNRNRHEGLEWAKVLAKLHSPIASEKLWSLNEMERTGGEPDVVAYDNIAGKYFFFDC
jgi:hypothetical protein